MCDGLTASSFLARGSLHRFVRAIIFCRGVVELINSRAAFFPCDYISVIAYVFSLILLHLSPTHITSIDLYQLQHQFCHHRAALPQIHSLASPQWLPQLHPHHSRQKEQDLVHFLERSPIEYAVDRGVVALNHLKIKCHRQLLQQSFNIQRRIPPRPGPQPIAQHLKAPRPQRRARIGLLLATLIGVSGRR